MIDQRESRSMKKRKKLFFKSIHDALQKYEIEQKDSAAIKNVLSVFYREKGNFAVFSQKASGIWHNQVDENEFEAFKQSIEQHLLGDSYMTDSFLLHFI